MVEENKDRSENWTLKKISDGKYLIFVFENKDKGIYLDQFIDIKNFNFDDTYYNERIFGPNTINKLYSIKSAYKRKIEEEDQTIVFKTIIHHGIYFQVFEKIRTKKPEPKSKNIKHCSDIDLVNELKNRLQNKT